MPVDEFGERDNKVSKRFRGEGPGNGCRARTAKFQNFRRIALLDDDNQKV